MKKTLTVCLLAVVLALGAVLLAACDPDLVVISCGKDNSYGHPHKETIDNYD